MNGSLIREAAADEQKYYSKRNSKLYGLESARLQGGLFTEADAQQTEGRCSTRVADYIPLFHPVIHSRIPTTVKIHPAIF
jgi:hypothetical protein